jgi:hypothetical protein
VIPRSKDLYAIHTSILAFHFSLGCLEGSLLIRQNEVPKLGWTLNAAVGASPSVTSIHMAVRMISLFSS